MKKHVKLMTAMAMTIGMTGYANATNTINIPLSATIIDLTQVGINADYTDGTWNNTQSIDFGAVNPTGTFVTQSRNVLLTVPAGASLKAKVTGATLLNGSNSIPVAVVLNGTTLDTTSVEVVPSAAAVQSLPSTLALTPDAITGKPVGAYVGNVVVTVERGA
ncbi:hypothetical protein [Aeromonas hydrophila]|uniref:hypothetical protein n=1 Tax=Aeromonas hydrophila TaxID=644 RepID=UPI001269CF6E|nr:hypothetical protein [Aeromonas hydrophila]